MAVFVSLFRGINVGGHRKIKMDELKAVHESLGFRDVVPYIQSGNVVFKSDDADVVQLQKQLEEGIEKNFGFHVDVIIRTSAEFSDILEKNPFQNQPDRESKWLAVMFLATRPDDLAQEDLLKTYIGPEEFCVIDKEVYIYYTDGIGRSKLSHTLIEKKLKTFGTARNWNTVLRLWEIMQR